MRSKIKHITIGAVIAAMYVALTFVSAMLGLSGGVIQLRLAEALAVLVCFTPAAVPGLTIGCLMANILTGCIIWDTVAGTLATLAAAWIARLMKLRGGWATVPNIILNSLILPPILVWVYGADMALPPVFATVLVGEVLSCGILGTVLYRAVEKSKIEEIFN